ncbi:MAG: class I SAM-dependent methyltransferase [Syntrophales bacterium]|nr:class I SAM-dependent methyltransferase [Syntrophales bacterium]
MTRGTRGNNGNIISYENWLASPVGIYVKRRMAELLSTLIRPAGGQRLLDVGCKTGHWLALFKRMGCLVTGIETSRTILDHARERMGKGADLHVGDYEDLPFSDNEFDIVTLITSLESTSDPRAAISEAVRVSRGMVCLGLFNRISLSAHYLRNFALPERPSSSLGIFETMRMTRDTLSSVPMEWGSVIFFPLPWYPRAEELERRIPMTNNPFGSFAALSFPVIYTHRTIEEKLGEEVPAGMGGNSRVAGTACKTKGGLLL